MVLLCWCMTMNIRCVLIFIIKKKKYIYICCINLANMHEFHLVLQERKVVRWDHLSLEVVSAKCWFSLRLRLVGPICVESYFIFFFNAHKDRFAKKAQLIHLCPVTCTFDLYGKNFHLSGRAVQRRWLHCISWIWNFLKNTPSLEFEFHRVDTSKCAFT